MSETDLVVGRRPARSGRAARHKVPVGRPIPALHFPDTLPVSLRRDEIAAAIAAHPVVIVCGETGSGKTTQLPKICLALGRGLGAGGRGLIGHTQPRRIAAASVAKRIAEELGSPLGEHVGFKVRFTDTLTPGASVKIMTDGILLAETQTDRLLRAYDTLIIDEAHERSLNIDFLLGYLKQVLRERPDLKVIVTSATIDAERFARHFASDHGPAPVIEVSGRLFPVEIRYRPVQGAARSEEANQALIEAVDELAQQGSGDILVFLPGEREIREAAELLRKHPLGHSEILPLYARLSAAEQQRVFHGGASRRIVLATNVAETSLTVPGVRYVIDTGLARVKRYSYRNKVEQLHIEPISQAAANQRAGRCGRVADGVCIRLYSEDEFALRPAYSDPEILRSSLAGVILRMKALGLGEVAAFPFLEPPSGRAIADGYQLLTELNAVDDTQALTEIGRQVARLPLDPRLARMLLAARDHQCLAEMLVIAAALSVQEVRERPLELQQAADTAHQRFADARSEFVAYLKIWAWYQEAVAEKTSQRQLREACKQHFLSVLRLREWHDVYRQLHTTVSELGWRVGTAPATYEQLHLALLTGLLGNVGLKSDTEVHFLGARGIKFLLWPGSALSKKPGRWVMAAELIETTKLYARTVAKIEPGWIETVGAHLLKRSVSEPHWEKSAGRAQAMERATLYGLPVYQQRRIDFSTIDAPAARALLIREGLVAGMHHDAFEPRSPAVAAMLNHNRQLIRAVEQLEHQSRRPDVLVDDELIVALCEQRIPKEVSDQRAFEAWYGLAVRSEPDLLHLTQSALMRHEAAGVTSAAFPGQLEMGGLTLALEYHFEPGSVRDGVTLTVPIYGLNQLDAKRCEWLVPGMREDKVLLLVKSLPHKLRRHLVPLAQVVEGFLARYPEPVHQMGLVAALVVDLRQQYGLAVSEGDFKQETLPAHLQMNFRVVDGHGRQLAGGRNLAALRAELGGEAQRQFQVAFSAARAKQVVTPPSAKDVPSAQLPAAQGLCLPESPEASHWPDGLRVTAFSFGRLPELMELEREGQLLVGYPALVDVGDGCEIALYDDAAEAAAAHRLGLRRLFALQLKEPLKYLQKNLPGMTRMALHFVALGSLESLRDQILDVALERACLSDPLPVDESEFNQRLSEARPRLALIAQEIARQTESILIEYAALQKRLPSIRSHPAAYEDMQQQLTQLIGAEFVRRTPAASWPHLTRYLKAIAARIDKVRADAARDARLLAEIAPLEARWRRTVTARRGHADQALLDFGWLLQELRVALFAQELRTPMPVSVKRLQKIWDSLER